MTTQTLRLTRPQLEFVAAREPFPCFCGGYGAGKTHALITRALVLKLRYPRQRVAYYLPTLDLVRQVAFPRFAEAFADLGIPLAINKSFYTAEVGAYGEIVFRSLDAPERIVGYEVADSFVDELDTLKTEHAREAWQKIIARNRQPKPDGSTNTVGVATTPEGFRFVYEQWHKKRTDGYRLIRAPSRSNPKLNADYIKQLTDTYPANVLAAYLEGEFVNLTSGSVYPEFDRNLNASSETVRAGETLHIGMDFNVTKMAAAIHVMRDGDPHAVAELVNVFDTPAMIRMIQDRYPDHPVMVYPDASGKSRKSVNASESDLSLLRQAKFTVCTNMTNPAVKDRVLSVNAMILRDGVRRYRINSDACPHLTEAIEKQAYADNGEPDKSTGLDHIIDAAGYFIAYRWPINRPVMSLNLGFAR